MQENKGAEIEQLVAGFAPVTLDEMDSIKLMNRVDTKYVATMDQLRSFLAEAGGRYRILVTDGIRVNSYDTVYYDTPDLQMYLAHHNRRLTRKKVRVRTYGNSGVSFLEIKKKNNHGRTKKKRVQCDAGNVFGPEQSSFLKEKSGYAPEDLTPRLETIFKRITLVNNAMSERLTIDMDLRFVNQCNHAENGLGPCAVIELKQDGLKPSDARTMLRELRVSPFKISKYCMGITLTENMVKHNRFKTKVRYIEKITGNTLL